MGHVYFTSESMNLKRLISRTKSGVIPLAHVIFIDSSPFTAETETASVF